MTIGYHLTYTFWGTFISFSYIHPKQQSCCISTPSVSLSQGKLIQTQKTGFFPNNCVKPCLDPKVKYPSNIHINSLTNDSTLFINSLMLILLLSPQPLFQSFPSRQPSRETDYYGYPWYDPSPWIHYTCFKSWDVLILKWWFSVVWKYYLLISL